MPRKATTSGSKEAINLLYKVFSKRSSQFNILWEYLRLKKIRKAENVIACAGILSRECEHLKLKVLTLNMFQYIFFVQRVVANNDSEEPGYWKT